MARRGPIPKGNRAAFTFKLPVDALELYRELAEAEGMPVGDYLTWKLATAHGMQEPAYLRRKDSKQQRELPISA